MVKLQVKAKCPTCGTALSGEGGSDGLCPGCLLELALDDTGLEAEVLFEFEEAPTLQLFAQGFSEGDIHGERYRIRSLLGRGGMGEVWRAYDLKLRLDVALKALRTELIQDHNALETLRQEVRVAREVISPNVCRVFDLEELDGQELISMEYVDGTTLQEILKERGPLELNEAREIASQFLAGLEAIHDAGLAHRDVKPENLMITRTGRVVVMDFGIAKGLGDGQGGMVAGTPAYMSPEQAKGLELDARSDLFSAGVVLAEMVEPGGVGNFEDRKRIWDGLHRETPQLSETPWFKVIAKAVSAEAQNRYASASALARALEEVTLRAAGDETARPYPGLSAFQEEDAEFFYGRELEVEALWKKLRRPHLLAVIGPSGAGKSSFLRAGLLPTLTDGWQAIIATPGNRPFANLARALAERLPADPATVDALMRFEEPEVAVDLIAQWREQHRHGLIIVDQFEELFTQNPEEIQTAFAELLGRLPLEADFFVLLSMRDDFLYHCHRYEAFQPILSDLTLLGPPTGASMRRAIVEPALRCGYRFETESIIEEMLAEVEGERGALPMVAFSAARLWDKRDSDNGLLTREAYGQIGGVGGALAQHAEATLEEIGEDRIPIVREQFRNLVTAQGTRAARDRRELISVFDGGATAGIAAAEEVLNTLIDARLLTSYEVTGEEGEHSHHRIEIVHESLLTHWPRLLRWQMQDAEGAKLRDELRSQAKLWEEHGRSEDYLWTGTAFKEYKLWWERYRGALSAIEVSFADAMTALAEKKRRRRRIAVSSVVLLSLAAAMVMAGLWLRSEAQARRAEAAKLLALGRLEMETLPTASVAYALASLGMADTAEGRLFAVEALWRRPTATIMSATGGYANWQSLDFSPDGQWLALAGPRDEVLVWSHEGGSPRLLRGHGTELNRVQFSSEGDSLFTWSSRAKRLRVWSTQDWHEIRSQGFKARTSVKERGGRVFTFTKTPDGTSVHIRSWPIAGGEPTTLGTWDVDGIGDYDVDPAGSFLAYSSGSEIHFRYLAEFETTHEYLVGRHDAEVSTITIDRSGERLAALDYGGQIRLWSLASQSASPVRELEAGLDVEGLSMDLAFDPTGSKLALGLSDEGVRLWDLDGPPGAEPVLLHGDKAATFWSLCFHPSGRWLAAAADSPGAILWPLGRPYAGVLEGHSDYISRLVFGPDSSWLASASADGKVRVWPMRASGEQTDSTPLYEAGSISISGLAVDPVGERLLVGEMGPNVSLVSLGQGAPKRLPGFTTAINMMAVAFSADGRLAAAGPGFDPEGPVIRVWDLESGDVRVLEPDVEPRSNPGNASFNVTRLDFLSDGRLVSAGVGGIHLWDLDGGTHTVLFEDKSGDLVMSALSASRKSLLFWRGTPGQSPSDLFHHHFETGRTRAITSHGVRVTAVALDPSGTIAVTGDLDGVVRVGAVTGQQPHLLFGHEKQIWDLAVSPDGRWIASGDQEGTIRLWPMPDLSQPPFHTLSHEEFLARLRSLTNLRVVEDSTSPTGYNVEPGPFPGWEEVPEW